MKLKRVMISKNCFWDLVELKSLKKQLPGDKKVKASQAKVGTKDAKKRYVNAQPMVTWLSCSHIESGT